MCIRNLPLSLSLCQISEEVAKLLELKAQLGDDQPKKFVLKCPKVRLPGCVCCIGLHF